MASGLFLFHKEQGMTSQTAARRVSRLYGGEKAGHTGTLDPLAEGVLPVLDRFHGQNHLTLPPSHRSARTARILLP